MDAWLHPDSETGEIRHTVLTVYSEMLLQVCSDYPGLPDPRTLTMSEIRFFYEGRRRALQDATHSGGAKGAEIARGTARADAIAERRRENQ